MTPELKVVAVCELCKGDPRGMYWGWNIVRNCNHYVPCPRCRPDEEQTHPHHPTMRPGDGE